MNIALWIQTISTLAMAIVAVAMLRSARATKKLEEANLKIARWPEIRQFITTKYNFISDMIGGEIRTGSKLYSDYLTEFLFVRFYFQDNDVLITHLNEFLSIGDDLMSIWGARRKSTELKENKDDLAKFGDKVKFLTDTSLEIDNILRDRYNLIFPIEKS